MTDIQKENKSGGKVPNNPKQIPNLRFTNFSEPWKSIRLADICEINPKNESLPSSFIYIDLESVANGQLLKEDFISKNEAPSRAQRVLSKNDVLFQMVRPYQKNNLFFDKEGKYVASTGYAQIRTKQNPQFVFQYLHNQRFVDNVIERCTGTSYPAINSKDLGNIQIDYPCLEEQKKISSFLALLDERIQTQNKIIEQLETLIKNVSEKIFSQNIKFKKIEEKWELKTLGEILIEINERTINSNQYRILSSTAKGLFYQSDYFNKEVASKDNAGYKILKINQLVFSPQNLWLGNINVNTTYEIGIVSPSYKVFSFNEKAIVGYCKYFLKSSKMMFEYEQCSEQGASIVRRNLNMELFLNIPILLPKLEEQIQISSFLTKIDQKIQTEKAILKQLEMQKKYLLQQMFV